MTRLQHLGLEGSSRMGARLDRRSPRFGKGFLLPLLAIFALLGPSLAGVASAGVNTWTTNGPDGGDIRALAIDPANPATLYAGTEGGGVFKSTNGGGSWNAVNAGLTGSLCRRPGHRSFGAGHALRRALTAASSRARNGGEAGSAINRRLTGCPCPGD